MFAEGAKPEDINNVLESEDGNWILKMLDIERSVDVEDEVEETVDEHEIIDAE